MKTQFGLVSEIKVAKLEILKLQQNSVIKFRYKVFREEDESRK